MTKRTKACLRLLIVAKERNCEMLIPDQLCAIGIGYKTMLLISCARLELYMQIQDYATDQL
jgi:hypothetical protein